MADVRELFLATAAAAVDAFDDPAVAAGWERPSALEGMTVGALVAHEARALGTVRRYLAGDPPPPRSTAVDAADYVIGALPDTDAGSAANRAVLERAVEASSSGHGEVTRQAHEDLRTLRDTLPHLSAGHTLAVLDGVVMLLDEYLRTRIVELVVHHDDLDVSLEGAPRRALPDEAGAVAVATLAEVARRRSSTAAMIAALARAERVEGSPPRAL